MNTAEPARPLPADNHVHTEWSWDTWTGASMMRACEYAVNIGLPAVAFTEHVDFNVWGEGDKPPFPTAVPGDKAGHRPDCSPLDVTGYLRDVERCRDRYPGLRILTGIEAGEPHLFPASVQAVLAAGPFERVLGSLHSVREGERLVSPDRLFATVGPRETMRRYLREVLCLVRESSVFQVLAHCDFPRRYWPDSAAPFQESDYEDEYREVFAALAASGRVLEINTRSPLWSVDLMRWWHQEGGEAVSFGSDAHRHHRLGARFDVARDVVEAAGFRPGRDRFDFWRR